MKRMNPQTKDRITTIVMVAAVFVLASLCIYEFGRVDGAFDRSFDITAEERAQ